MAEPVVQRNRPRAAGARLLLLALAAMLLAACAAAPAAQPAWREIYRRPGWAGGPTLDLRAVGDVMLARRVGQLAARNGAGYPFALAGGILAGDMALGNLESPLTARRDAVRPGPYRLLADPGLAQALGQAGFSALGLANNHGLDGGPDGLGESMTALREAGIAPLGAGDSPAAALAPATLRAGGLRVALLALNDVLDPADGPATLAPAGDQTWRNPDFAACAAACPPGRAWLGPAALKAVSAARADADAVVVLVHWGAEYAAEPSARQRAWAARLIAAGADLVLGAHPHVAQPAEPLAAGGRSGFVAYSLGNFVFDGPADPTLSNGLALRVLLDTAGVAQVFGLPLALDGGQPRPQEPTPAPAPAATQPTPAAPARAAGSAIAAWRWDGAAGRPVAPPAAAATPARPARLAADLRGNGAPLWASLADGVVTLRDGPAGDAPVVWTNESPAWRFTRVLAGDPNDDGRAELLLLLWQRDRAGQLRSQPYLLGWRGGRFQIIWGGSPTSAPIQDLATADLDGDGRAELVALEGGAAPGDPGEAVSVWHWHGWGFQREWRSPPGVWRSLALTDLDGDGRAEILAGP